MPEKLEGIMKNLKDASSWTRVFIAGIFVLFLYLVVGPLVIVILVTQILFNLLSGSSNSNLAEFSELLIEYIKQILNFILYRCDEKPFPFSGFPANTGEEESMANVTADSIKTPARRKSKRKKTAKKKLTKKE